MWHFGGKVCSFLKHLYLAVFWCLLIALNHISLIFSWYLGGFGDSRKFCFMTFTIDTSYSHWILESNLNFVPLVKLFCSGKCFLWQLCVSPNGVVSYATFRELHYISCVTLHFVRYTTFLALHYISCVTLHFLPYTTFRALHYISFVTLHFVSYTTFRALHYISCVTLHFVRYTTFRALHYISCVTLHFVRYTTFFALH